MKEIKVDPVLVRLINIFEGRSFSVVELRDLYLSEIDASVDKAAQRMWVYRHIKRLASLDLLKEDESKSGGRDFFVVTDRWNEISSRAPDESPSTNAQSATKRLRQKLNHYKAELLASIGEADEYQKLQKEYPDLVSQISEQYNQARDKASKLLGSIKAIENLLKQV